MKKMVLDHKAYEETARQAVAEGAYAAFAGRYKTCHVWQNAVPLL